MQSREARNRIASIAETQRGQVTTGQAARLDVSKLDFARMEDAGDVTRMAHGVYRIVGSDEGAHADLFASWLALEPARTVAERLADRDRVIAVSHRSAAEVYGIGDLPATTDHFTASFRKQVTRPGVRISQRSLTHGEVRVEHGMLVTTPERTIADLARSEADTSHVADALADALHDRRTSRAKVIEAMPGRSMQDKARAVDSMLAYSGLSTQALAERFLASEPGRAVTDQILDSMKAALEPQIAILAESLVKALPPIDVRIPEAPLPPELREIIDHLSREYAHRALVATSAALPWEEFSEMTSDAEALSSDAHA